MKLYRVQTKTLESFVVAGSATEAEKSFVEWLNREDYGLVRDRSVWHIECLADTEVYPNDENYHQLILPVESAKEEK